MIANISFNVQFVASKKEYLIIILVSNLLSWIDQVSRKCAQNLY